MDNTAEGAATENALALLDKLEATRYRCWPHCRAEEVAPIGRSTIVIAPK